VIVVLGSASDERLSHVAPSAGADVIASAMARRQQLGFMGEIYARFKVNLEP
jgi:hypothetical protein